MRIFIQTVLIAILLSLSYYTAIKNSGFKPHFAESNFISNQMKLQSLRHGQEQIGIAITGSSMAARLYSGMMEGTDPGINVSLDGSRAILGIHCLLESGKEIDTILIEMNSMTFDSRANDRVITASMDSGTERLADYFPLVRAEMRPITLLYSGLKNYKDIRLASSVDVKSIAPIPINMSNYNGGEDVKCEELEALLCVCRSRGIRVVLMMLPDGGRSSKDLYQLSSAISSKYGLEFIDLKGNIPEKLLTYTDGLHLSVPSAKYVSLVISKTINASTRPMLNKGEILTERK